MRHPVTHPIPGVSPAALHPIIYVRGYAMTRTEIDETTVDPFCGFNIGSTVYRATPDKERPARKFIFESPLVRLAKDFGYRDAYADGEDVIQHKEWQEGIPRQSVIIYRYYEGASSLLGTGVPPDIKHFAQGLSALVARVRDLVVTGAEGEMAADDFRCYLVAHSMGGLVCRAFLQNPACDPEKVQHHVDKLFTYATPHNGIDLAGVNVPAWLGIHDVSNFSRDRMAEYLDLEEVYRKQQRVDLIPEDRFPSAKVFCLVGTNRADYEAAQGVSRTFAGHGSDGLVRIENAVVCGFRGAAESSPTAKAFVYRAHSGYFGIVNSEEAYQNLTRFLFGDYRVDIWVDLDDFVLPEGVERAAVGREVDALYQIEVLASPRGKLWYLTRRIAEEDSVACLRHKDWVAARAAGRPVELHVSTVFLARRAMVRPDRKSLAYSLTLGIRVPDYEVDRKLWIDDHFEGGYLFRDTATVEAFLPDGEPEWRFVYDWQRDDRPEESRVLDTAALRNGPVTLRMPFAHRKDRGPGVQGAVRFVLRPWNGDRP